MHRLLRSDHAAAQHALQASPALPCPRRPALPHHLPALLQLLPALLLVGVAAVSAQVRPQSAAALQQSAVAPKLTDGALLDADRAAVALMTPDGEVEAVDAASGQILWLSSDAAKPLGYFGDYVVAQRESDSLEIVFLERTSGAVADELSIDLPQGTTARIDDSFSQRFETSLRLAGGSPLVSWTQTETYSRGVPPAPGEPLATSASRAHRIDVISMSSAEVPLTTALASQQLPPAVTTWLARTPAAAQPKSVDDTAVAVFHGSGRRDVSLRTWDLTSGQTVLETVIHRGDFAVFETSVDGRHVAVIEDVGGGRYQWSLFESTSAEPIGGFEADHSFAPFAVAGETALFTLEPRTVRTAEGRQNSPRLVRAQSLATGAVLWQRPLRETRYSGPRPH